MPDWAPTAVESAGCRELDDLAAAAGGSAFRWGHASPEWAQRALLSISRWRVLVCSADVPSTKRGLV